MFAIIQTYIRNICSENLFGTYVLLYEPFIFIIEYGGDHMQEMSIRTTAQIYDFSELQKKKHQRELREKRPLFLTGAILFICLSIGCFLYFGNSIVKAKEPVSDIQYKVIEIKEGDSLWSIAKENMATESNHTGFTDIYQYIREIKKCNNMNSSQINAGCYLMIPYYNMN